MKMRERILREAWEITGMIPGIPGTENIKVERLEKC